MTDGSKAETTTDKGATELNEGALDEASGGLQEATQMESRKFATKAPSSKP